MGDDGLNYVCKLKFTQCGKIKGESDIMEKELKQVKVRINGKRIDGKHILQHEVKQNDDGTFRADTYAGVVIYRKVNGGIVLKDGRRLKCHIQ